MSKILEGLDKAVDQKIQNIISQNPKGSAAEQILLGKFLNSDQGSYARNVLGKNHKGWIEHITTWLKKNQPRLEKEFNELDFSDLTSLAYDMYENYLAKQGQLEEASKAEIRANLDQDIKDFLSKGGEIEKLKPNKVRAIPGMGLASKHIGTAGEINRKTRSKMLVGKGRNVHGTKPVVNVEEGNVVSLHDEQKLLSRLIRDWWHGNEKQHAKATMMFDKMGYEPYEDGDEIVLAKGDDEVRFHMNDIIEGYSAGASGGAGLDIEKSPMEKVLERPLGEHINSPGGMGQSYRKFTPKITERYDEWDEADTWYIFDYASGKLKQRSFKHAQEREAKNSGYSQSIEQALRKAGIIRSKFDPKKFVQKTGEKWVEVFPFGKKEMSEEQAPMFTPEDKMVNANDPRSDGWRVYKAQPSGMLEGILQEYDTKTIDQVVERLPKGLTVDNFAIPAFKEYLYQKYYAVERPNWKELSAPFAQEYRQKHGIKEYKLGDLDYFDNMLLVLPKGLSPEQLNVQGFKEFIYQKHGSKEWPDFKKNRYTYWDAYQKAGGTQKQGFISKMKAKMGLDEADTALPLDMAYSQARQITKMIKYDDTVNDIIVKITMLAEKAGISEDEFKYAIDEVYAAHRKLESAVYGLDEVFKEKLDAQQSDVDESMHKESAIMKGLQTEQDVNEYDVDSQRTITFSKENPPSMNHLYQAFIEKMLSDENTVEPKVWIDSANKRYGLSYTYKNYQDFGHRNDHVGGWDKFVQKHVLKK